MLHIAERCEALMPSDPDGRMRTTAWMFAALNTVEPPIQTLAGLDLFYAGEAWASARRPDAVAAVQKRIAALEDWLGGRDYLEDRFTAGDLLMTTVLRILRHTDIVSERPALMAYQERCEARPAFRKALAEHLNRSRRRRLDAFTSPARRRRSDLRTVSRGRRRPGERPMRAYPHPPRCAGRPRSGRGRPLPYGGRGGV